SAFSLAGKRSFRASGLNKGLPFFLAAAIASFSPKHEYPARAAAPIKPRPSNSRRFILCSDFFLSLIGQPDALFPWHHTARLERWPDVLLGFVPFERKRQARTRPSDYNRKELRI